MYNSVIKGTYNLLRRRSKSFCCLALVSVLFCSCSFGKTSVKFQTDERESESEIINVQIPQISGLKEEFCNEINAYFKEKWDNKINAFLEISEETKEKRDGKSKLIVTQDVTYNEKNLLSVLGEAFEYTSGMTGLMSREVINIDTASEKRIYLSDLFNDNEYVDLLNARLEKLAEGEQYSDIWEKPIIGEAQNELFYFSNDGLVIFYPPYELSYYARGFVEFTVPYSELYGYLKPEYSQLY